MQFDEYVFLWALIHRPHYGVTFASTWDSSWMKDVSLIPVTEAINHLAKKYNTSPSFKVLKEYLVDKNGEEVFKNRQEKIIEELINMHPDEVHIGYTMEKARETAIVRSFENFVSSFSFNKAKEEMNGKAVLKDVNEWMGRFLNLSDEETMPIDEAVNKLFTEGTFITREPISCGITAIDRFTAGGLKPGQLGIFMAPTGQGKSTILLNIGYRTALIDSCETWFVSNELTMAEQTERFLGRMTGVSMNQIQSNPLSANYGQVLDKHWNEYKIQDRLLLTTILKPFSTKELESSLMRRKAITGWSPKLLVLDYMERMVPNTHYHGEKEWTSLGRIAADLIQFAKKHNIAIWTATQTNRSGLKENAELEMDMSQASIRHLQEASYVISLQKHPIPGGDENKEAFKLKTLKSRHAKNTGKAVFLEVDLDKMLVTDKEIDFELAPKNNSTRNRSQTTRESLEDDGDDESIKPTGLRSKQSRAKKII